jgi:hypothetical protein
MTPDLLLLARQALLFAHLMAFAIAISVVLRTDLALLRAGGIEMRRIDAAARELARTLAVLWISGLLLVLCDAMQTGAQWVFSDKLQAKLWVVAVLSANGVALHRWVLPRVRRPAPAGTPASAPAATFAALLVGAVSTTSWLYASFVGVSRVIAPLLSLADYLLLYGAALAAALVLALTCVRPRLGAAAQRQASGAAAHSGSPAELAP